MTTHCPKGHPVTWLDDIERWHCSTCGVAYLPSQVHEQADLFPKREPPKSKRPPRLQQCHIGIDPGATTGIAVLDDDGQLLGSWVVEWRTAQDARGGHDLERVAAEVACLVGGRHGTRGSAERPVAARKGVGSVKSWVGLGAYLGRTEQALFRALGFYPDRVEVKEWRETLGLAAACEKSESIARARAVPGAAHIEDHNEAEAVCIAEAGRRMRG